MVYGELEGISVKQLRRMIAQQRNWEKDLQGETQRNDAKTAREHNMDRSALYKFGEAQRRIDDLLRIR